MKIFLNAFLLMFLSLTSLAQRAEVVKVLNSYQIDAKVLNNQAKEKVKTLAFDLRQTTSFSTSEKIELAAYDGSKAEGTKWTLKSVNGKRPLAKEINSFIKAHPDHPPVATVDENSYKIISESNDKLVVEFSYLEASLTPENIFLKDCKGKLFVNKITKRIESQEVQSIAPLKIKGIKVSKLLTTSTYIFDRELGEYLITKETTNLIIQLLVMSSDSVITSEYSNYRKP